MIIGASRNEVKFAGKRAKTPLAWASSKRPWHERIS
jgi:hypothetical protein